MDDTVKTQDRTAVEILVVEDSPTQAEQLRYLLEQQGYQVRVAGNGREALDALGERRPTLIISDVVMPEMDGYALCRAVKSEPQFKDLPVVIVTSLSGIQDIAKALDCGADNFIRKPYDPQMMLARVEYILLNQQLRKRREAAADMELYLQGKKQTINTGRTQIVDLLISTYEEAVKMNEELQAQQKEIARANRVLAGLYDIADGLNRVYTESEVCEQALGNVLAMPKFQGGWIFLADGEGGWRLAAHNRLPAALKQPSAFAGDCPCQRAVCAGSAPRGTSMVECDRLGEAAGGSCERHVSTALGVGGECHGIFNVVLAKGESLSPDDVRMLDAVASQVGVALERARLYQHLEDLVAQRTGALREEVAERTRAEARVASLNRIYAVLSGINSTIVRVHDRLGLFQDACRIAVEHGGFGLAWIGVADMPGGPVKPVAWKASSAWTAFPGIPKSQETSGGIIAQAMRERRTVVCRDLTASADGPMAKEATAQGYRAAVVLPLLLAGKPVGVLALYAVEPSVFDAQELRLLEELAGDISFALDYLEKEERVNYLAYYDALTGLANRALLLDRLQQGIGSAQRHRRSVAVLCLDIDRFKVINDGLGHHVGDRLLRSVGERLAGCVRDGDTVGRIAGDEFVLVCCELAGEEDISLVTRRVYEALAAPIVVEQENLPVTVSMGISLYPTDGDDPGVLLKNAELAMYQAKQEGRSHRQFFTAELGARISGRLQVESRLAQAVDNGEFAVFYQPQVNAVSGAIDGMEALVRWRHPERGIVPPDQFIPVAEDTRLIVQIGEKVLREACRQAKAWQDEGLCDFPVSVNLSVAQYREESLLASVRRILDETGLPPHSLELEITESVVMGNAETFIAFLRELKALGMLVAIDDFGTGYSSFSYLKRLPLDRLKVDQSFVRDIATDRDSAAICRAIIALAHNLHLGVVAEGVEDEAQAAYLARHYCDTLQGYHMSRPLPADEITAMLRKGKPLLQPMTDLASRRTVLVVDGDDVLRQSLSRLLLPEGYRVLLAPSREDAVGLLTENEVGVVLAGRNLTHAAGAEFMQQVKEMSPGTIRIALTAHGDLPVVTASMQQGTLYKYLLEPWDNEVLRLEIRDAFWQYELSRGTGVGWYPPSAGGWDTRLGEREGS